MLMRFIIDFVYSLFKKYKVNSKVNQRIFAHLPKDKSILIFKIN